VLKVTRKSEQQ